MGLVCVVTHHRTITAIGDLARVEAGLIRCGKAGVETCAAVTHREDAVGGVEALTVGHYL